MICCPGTGRFAVVSLALVTLNLIGCGGGGGGSNQATVTPPVPTTPNISAQRVRIGSVSRTDIRGNITLSESGQALAVWSNEFQPPVVATWSRSDANGAWSTPQPIPAGEDLSSSFVLRGVTDGSAVLHSADGVVRRFLPATNQWIEIGSMGLGVGEIAIFGRTSDPLVYDGMLPAVTLSQSSTKILSQAASGAWSTRYDLGAFSTLIPSIAVTRESIGAGTARVLGRFTQTVNTQAVTQLRVATVDLQGTNPPHIAELNTGLDSVNCADFRAEFVTSASWSVAAQQATGTDGACNLAVARFDNVTFQPRVQKLNATGYTTKSAPKVLMDGQGNALVVWEEMPLGSTVPRRLRWSQSLAGGQWTEPQSVPAPLQYEWLELYKLSIAMNKSGQAALVARAITAEGLVGPTVKARFFFGSGWTDLALLSGFTPGSGAPNGTAVAINERGDAIAMYSDAGNVYAIRF